MMKKTFKKQNACIKHRLWGKLKRQAHEHYRIAPSSYGTPDRYDIEYCDVDGYWWPCDSVGTICLTLEKAKEKVNKKRDIYFLKLCNDTLYQRRLERLSKY